MNAKTPSLIATDALQKITAPLSQAWTLPPQAYTSCEILRQLQTRHQKEVRY